ncbi:hypothetical protein [Ammoniphilus sp. CFH 90114]|uniref:hypothetical protein n=1 Tax=Ammoniphilus sp. CFH 90114 TaxID=2493665 RepID=UPI00100EF5A2|nr:hypothetical protein [Ammoniphilus sp. CFH 90114]RXT15194.1 hypothetical protein EIZ39_03000 [Ammoniphilus sp. CFH 90114]
MPNDIFRNKRDFARAEFATEFYKPAGRPRPREAKSQVRQYAPEHYEGLKNKKVPFHKKIGNPGEQ